MDPASATPSTPPRARGRRRGATLVDANVHFFDAFATEYDDWAGGLHRRIAARLVELSGPRRGETVLDVGCGTGLVSNAAARLVGPTGHVQAIDVSPRMLDRAAVSALPNTQYHRMSGDRLWFRDFSFDLVTYGNSLSYLDDPLEALREARRVLRLFGRVAASVRKRSLSTYAQEAFFMILNEATRHHPMEIPRPADDRSSFGEVEVVSRLFERAGFREVKTATTVTGARMRDARAWITLMEWAGPRPHSLLSTMGPGMLRRLEQAVERQMDHLGDDAFHYHEAFTFITALR